MYRKSISFAAKQYRYICTASLSDGEESRRRSQDGICDIDWGKDGIGDKRGGPDIRWMDSLGSLIYTRNTAHVKSKCRGTGGILKKGNRSEDSVTCRSSLFLGGRRLHGEVFCPVLPCSGPLHSCLY